MMESLDAWASHLLLASAHLPSDTLTPGGRQLACQRAWYLLETNVTQLEEDLQQLANDSRRSPGVMTSASWYQLLRSYQKVVTCSVLHIKNRISGDASLSILASCPQHSNGIS